MTPCGAKSGWFRRGLGQVNQVDACEVLWGRTQYEVFRAGVHEGAVGRVLRGGLHMKVHTGFAMDPMALVLAVEGREPHITRLGPVAVHELAPPREGGAGTVAAKGLAPVWIQEDQVVVHPLRAGPQQEDPVGADAVPAVTPALDIPAVGLPTGLSGTQVECDEIVAGRIELDELHFVKVRGGVVAVEGGSEQNSKLS